MFNGKKNIAAQTVGNASIVRLPSGCELMECRLVGHAIPILETLADVFSQRCPQNGGQSGNQQTCGRLLPKMGVEVRGTIHARSSSPCSLLLP